ncbi:MAG: helix-turn-helix transcriptional regulator [Pseudomonadota bacterium]
MSTYLRDRIREIREGLGLGRQAFADKRGVKKATLKYVERGQQRATEELLVAIGENWPEYAYWLLTGKTIPDAGQISPDMERVELKKVADGTP